MTLALEAMPVPLVEAEMGTIRVKGSRVTLDVIIESFKAGESPEEILSDFPTLSLPDIYATVTYYLNHKPEVEEYLTQRAARAAEVRKKIEDRWPTGDLQEKLLARRAAREK